MKKLKKISIIIVSAIIIISTLIGYYTKNISTSLNVVEKDPVKVGVLLYKFDDAYIATIRKNLEDIQKENQGKVEFIFFDGKGDQKIQDKSIDELLKKEDIDLLLLNLVDTGVTQIVIDKIKEKNIPVIFFNREPVIIDAIKSYGKSIFIGTDAKEAGILQGKILVDIWNTNKSAIDKNGDNIMQYVMLKGENDNIEAIERTKYSILKLNNNGIKTEQLALKIANWDKETAKNITKSLLLNYGNKIEAIIANNDAMAIGAIEALQEQGYNKGDKTKEIAVVGIDALPQAQELIKKGVMTGSVLQDSRAMSEALYNTGMNLVYGKNALDGTEYKFDDTEVAIRIPYKEYK